MLLPILSLLPLLPLAFAAGEPFEGKLNPLGKSPVPRGLSGLDARDCPGGPTNSFCCGAFNYCFNSEVCCDSLYCCPEGTTCLGGLLCSPGGEFTATGTFTEAPATITSPPSITSAFVEYTTYYYTITWYYFSYFYTYDITYETSLITSYEETTYTYLTITASDSSAADAAFTSLSAGITFSTPYSATALATATAVVPSVSKTSAPSVYSTSAKPTAGNYTSATASGPPPSQFTGAAVAVVLPRVGGVWGVFAGLGAVVAGGLMVVL